MILPALAARQGYYEPFARHLARHGFAVLTFDYRGIGASADGAIRGRSIRMADWGRLDIHAALSWATRVLAPERLIAVAHSAGGQLVGLAPACEGLDRLLTVACQSGYWRLWPRPHRYAVWALWHLVIPVFATGRDVFPARRLRVAPFDFPAGVAVEWAAWGRSPGYVFDAVHGLDTRRYGRLAIPILAYGFDDDLLYAPPRAIEALLERFSRARIERRQIARDDPRSVGHFGFFRESSREILWSEAVKWLRAGRPDRR